MKLSYNHIPGHRPDVLRIRPDLGGYLQGRPGTEYPEIDGTHIPSQLLHIPVLPDPHGQHQTDSTASGGNRAHGD